MSDANEWVARIEGADLSDATELRAIGAAMTALEEAVEAARSAGFSEIAIQAVLGHEFYVAVA